MGFWKTRGVYLGKLDGIISENPRGLSRQIRGYCLGKPEGYLGNLRMFLGKPEGQGDGRVAGSVQWRLDI